MPVPDSPSRILFVCTANQCRSVMAEAVAERRFAGTPFAFGSAGLIEGGRPMPPNGVRVATEHGFDTSRHLSEQLDTRRLGEWDLVLTMSRQHARELVAADPGLWPRVFTLPQFVRWLDEHPFGRHASLRSWLDQAATTRSRTELVGTRSADEIADPIDGPPRAWRELVTRLTDDLDRIARHLVGDEAPTGSGPHPAGHAIAEGRPVEEPRAAAARLGIDGERPLHGAPQLRRVRRTQ